MKERVEFYKPGGTLTGRHPQMVEILPPLCRAREVVGLWESSWCPAVKLPKCLCRRVSVAAIWGEEEDDLSCLYGYIHENEQLYYSSIAKNGETDPDYGRKI